MTELAAPACAPLESVERRIMLARLIADAARYPDDVLAWLLTGRAPDLSYDAAGPSAGRDLPSRLRALDFLLEAPDLRACIGTTTDAATTAAEILDWLQAPELRPLPVHEPRRATLVAHPAALAASSSRRPGDHVPASDAA